MCFCVLQWIVVTVWEPKTPSSHIPTSPNLFIIIIYLSPDALRLFLISHSHIQSLPLVLQLSDLTCPLSHLFPLSIISPAVLNWLIPTHSLPVHCSFHVAKLLMPCYQASVTLFPAICNLYLNLPVCLITTA